MGMTMNEYTDSDTPTEIYYLASLVFSDDTEMTKWFASNEIFSLNNEVPNDLMLTKEGRRRVRNALNGIINGFCA